MRSPVLERLRCAVGHPPAPLVAAVSRRDGHDVVEAELGCPVCGARHGVSGGVAVLGMDDPPPVAREPAGPEDVLRLAALLDLATPGGVVALAPAWAACAPPLARLVDADVLLLGDGDGAAEATGRVPGHERRAGVSPVRGVRVPPVEAGACRAAALDASVGGPALVDRWVAAVRPGGRIVGDAGVPVPAGVRELARDDRHWVGTRDAAPSAPVPLARRGGGSPAPGG